MALPDSHCKPQRTYGGGPALVLPQSKGSLQIYLGKILRFLQELDLTGMSRIAPGCSGKLESSMELQKAGENLRMGQKDVVV